MEEEKWSFRAWDLISVPNLLTYMRIILIIPFVYFFTIENYIVAAVFIGISGMTDCFDGMLARRLNQVTSLGKILDPIADKVTLFSVAVCMIFKFPKIIPLAVLLLLKEFIMLLCGFILIRNKITPPAAKWYGKVATVIFYFSMSVIIFIKAAFSYENDIIIFTLFAVTTAFMLFALANYAVIFINELKNKKSKN